MDTTQFYLVPFSLSPLPFYFSHLSNFILLLPSFFSISYLSSKFCITLPFIPLFCCYFLLLHSPTAGSYLTYFAPSVPSFLLFIFFFLHIHLQLLSLLSHSLSLKLLETAHKNSVTQSQMVKLYEFANCVYLYYYVQPNLL
jgi:hypothetical protein